MWSFKKTREINGFYSEKIKITKEDLEFLREIYGIPLEQEDRIVEYLERDITKIRNITKKILKIINKLIKLGLLEENKEKIEMALRRRAKREKIELDHDEAKKLAKEWAEKSTDTPKKQKDELKKELILIKIKLEKFNKKFPESGIGIKIKKHVREQLGDITYSLSVL